MEESIWFKLGAALVKLMPAIGGSLISLRYLDKEDTGPLAIFFSFICSIFLAYYGGHAVIEHFKIKDDTWSAYGIIFTIGVIGLVILNKLVQAVKNISVKDIKEWVLESLRKWIN